MVHRLQTRSLALMLAGTLMLVAVACSSSDTESVGDDFDLAPFSPQNPAPEPDPDPEPEPPPEPPPPPPPPPPEPPNIVLDVDEGLGDFVTVPAETGLAYLKQAPLVQPKTTVGVHFFEFGSPLSTDPLAPNPVALFSEPGERGSIVGVDEDWVVYRTPEGFQRYDRSRGPSATNPESAGESAIDDAGPFGGIAYAEGWFVTATHFSFARGYELYVDDIDDGLGADVQLLTDSASFGSVNDVAISEAGIAWVRPAFAGGERVLFREAPFDGTTTEIDLGPGRSPMISGEFLLFVVEPSSGDGVDLYGFDSQRRISEDNPIRLGRLADPVGNHTLSGSRAVWIEEDREDDQVFTADLAENRIRSRRISDREVDARRPAVSGDWVTWAQCREGSSFLGACAPGDYSEIVFYDAGPREGPTILSDSAAVKSDPSVSSVGVGWAEQGSGTNEIRFFDPTRPLDSGRNPVVVTRSDGGDRDPRMIEGGMFWHAPLLDDALRAAEAADLWDLVE